MQILVQKQISSSWECWNKLNLNYSWVVLEKSSPGKSVFTRSYPFCRNSDEIGSYFHSNSGEKAMGNACKGCHSLMWLTSVYCCNMDWMDLESEVSQSKTNTIWYHLYVESLKKKRYKWTYLQNRNRFTDLENKLMVTKREGGGRN